jgi:hypothetical protein
VSAISHSRVESYLTCRRKDYYGYQFPNEDFDPDTQHSRGIRRIRTSDSLALGSAIHRCLAAFYQTLLNAGDTHYRQLAAFNLGVEAAWAELAVLYGEGYENAGGRYSDIETILTMYFAHEPFILSRKGCVVLGVEMEFRLEYDTDTDASLPFVIDLIFRDEQGRVAVCDHKSSYNLFDEEGTDLMPQIPKYIAGVRALGYPAAYGVYNVLRTQKANGGKMLKAEIVVAIKEVMVEPPKDIDKLLVPALTELAIQLGIEPVTPPSPEQVLQIIEFNPSPTRITRTFYEQVAVAEEIAFRDTLPIEETERTAFRTANKMVCGHCQFSGICAEELRGGNVKAALVNEYEPKPRRAAIVLSNGEEEDATE